MSHGAAVSRIRLFEVIDPDKLAQPLKLPAGGSAPPSLFWREEMADGIIDPQDRTTGHRQSDRLVSQQSRTDAVPGHEHLQQGSARVRCLPALGLDAARRQRLGVLRQLRRKHLWAEIVELMGEYGFDVLPYYEYSGSKGYKGLGNQRRARPLTRDDAYTHITLGRIGQRRYHGPRYRTKISKRCST